MRIKEYDYFAPHNYALHNVFRYIADDRYDALSDELLPAPIHRTIS